MTWHAYPDDEWKREFDDPKNMKENLSEKHDCVGEKQVNGSENDELGERQNDDENMKRQMANQLKERRSDCSDQQQSVVWHR